jgi:tRNA G10  N-methylase Trm11
MLTLETEDWSGCYELSRAGLFTRESNRHPAKMAAGLCFRIFEHGERMGYWRKGDLILDPMAGIFTTGICGATMGYRALGIELEKHFYDLALVNIEQARRRFHSLGNCWIVQGDARNLQGTDYEAAITSPPYLAAPSAGGINVKGYGADGADKVGERTYSSRTVSGAVSSPPYADQQLTGQNQFRSAGQPNRPDAAENSREGYAGVVSSPTYGATDPSSSHQQGISRMNPDSPNFRPCARRDKQERDAPRPYSRGEGSPTVAQIGNLRDPKGDIDQVLNGKTGQTYLSAMLEVYRQLHLVLKPGGVVALVTKNPIKKGQLRRLDLDTIRLMEATGFELFERKRAMLAEITHQGHLLGEPTVHKRERKSFFKRLYEKNHPELAVDHEDVMFFRKNATAGKESLFL